ncbi:MAG: IPT/TIG domain-containing protein, partial [Thermoanaerobaculia bacterium]
MTNRSGILAVLAVFLLAPALFAHEIPWSIEPASGPTAGGTTVTIKGNFGSWPYSVTFGSVPAQSTTLVDEHTMVAVTPEHLPGKVDVWIFEYDIYLDPGLQFTFEGVNPETYERVLLPVLTSRVRGAHGSEWMTAFRAAHKSGISETMMYGAKLDCRVSCVNLPDEAIQLSMWGNGLEPHNFEMNGTPGRFLYIPKDDIDHIALSLHVADISRSTENYGTEMPIVRAREFTQGRILLLGIPTRPGFRSTLRIYADQEATVRVTIDGQNPIDIPLTRGTNDIY